MITEIQIRYIRPTDRYHYLTLMAVSMAYGNEIQVRGILCGAMNSETNQVLLKFKKH
jgi:hypothetical protein